jgi:hypothetical protein
MLISILFVPLSGCKNAFKALFASEAKVATTGLPSRPLTRVPGAVSPRPTAVPEARTIARPVAAGTNSSTPQVIDGQTGKAIVKAGVGTLIFYRVLDLAWENAKSYTKGFSEESGREAARRYHQSKSKRFHVYKVEDRYCANIGNICITCTPQGDQCRV